jgi:dynein heavy chain 2
MLDGLTAAVGQAPLLVQLKLKALILDLIHHIEVVDALVANGVHSLSEWTWYKQLRYELSDKQLAEVLMCKVQSCNVLFTIKLSCGR